jgi:hypothetical protein
MPRLKRKWNPHPKQAEILDDDARFKVVPAGRRFGKTYMARKGGAFETAFENPGAYVWYVAPTDDDARELAFEPLKNEIPNDLLAEELEESPPREITLANGSRIQFRSAASQSRGRGLDYVVIDEASEIEGRYWDAVIRPSLSDTGGGALIIGTPKGRNWFFKSYERGQDPEFDEWNSWRATTYDNPHIEDSEVEAAKRDLPDRVFEQEYLAKFVDSEGQVFPDPESVTRPYSLGVEGTPPYTTGVDLARTNNYLAVATLDADGMLVGFRRDRGGSWASAGRTLEQYLTSFPGVCYLDATRDNKIIEDLGRTVPDVQVEPVRFTPQNKTNMIENLAARLETNDIVLPDDDAVEQLKSEVRVFEFETTRAGNIRYGAPEGMNDDTVDALALAAKETQQAKATW